MDSILIVGAGVGRTLAARPDEGSRRSRARACRLLSRAGRNRWADHFFYDQQFTGMRRGVECLVIGQVLDSDQNEQLAHRRIVAGNRNPEESWANNNSPATGN